MKNIALITGITDRWFLFSRIFIRKKLSSVGILRGLHQLILTE